MPAITGRFLSMSIRKVRRHDGDSFAQQSAYINRTVVINPRTGHRHDYRKKDAVEVTGIAGWKGTHDQLVSAAVFSEKRRKAVEGRMAILALPEEFSQDERHAVTMQCAEYLAEKYQVAVAYAIHSPPEKGDQRNWHAHLLFTSRRVTEGLRLGHKTREWDALKTGGDHTEAFRSWWCAALNMTLQTGGRTANIQHKSFARLGIEDRAPSKHNGERRTEIIRKRTLRLEFSNQPEVRGAQQKFRPLMTPASEIKPIPSAGHKPTPQPSAIPNLPLGKNEEVIPICPSPPELCSSPEDGKAMDSSYELDFENPDRTFLKLTQRPELEAEKLRRLPPSDKIPDKHKDSIDDVEPENFDRPFLKLPLPQPPERGLEQT